MNIPLPASDDNKLICVFSVKMDKSSRPCRIRMNISIRSTQRPVSVKYLFGVTNIAYSFLLNEDDSKFLDVPFIYNFRSLSNKFPSIFGSTIFPKIFQFPN